MSDNLSQTDSISGTVIQNNNMSDIISQNGSVSGTVIQNNNMSDNLSQNDRVSGTVINPNNNRSDDIHQNDRVSGTVITPNEEYEGSDHGSYHDSLIDEEGLDDELFGDAKSDGECSIDEHVPLYFESNTDQDFEDPVNRFNPLKVSGPEGDGAQPLPPPPAPTVLYQDGYVHGSREYSAAVLRREIPKKSRAELEREQEAQVAQQVRTAGKRKAVDENVLDDASDAGSDDMDLDPVLPPGVAGRDDWDFIHIADAIKGQCVCQVQEGQYVGRLFGDGRGTQVNYKLDLGRVGCPRIRFIIRIPTAPNGTVTVSKKDTYFQHTVDYVPGVSNSGDDGTWDVEEATLLDWDELQDTTLPPFALALNDDTKSRFMRLALTVHAAETTGHNVEGAAANLQLAGEPTRFLIETLGNSARKAILIFFVVAKSENLTSSEMKAQFGKLLGPAIVHRLPPKLQYMDTIASGEVNVDFEMPDIGRFKDMMYGSWTGKHKKAYKETRVMRKPDYFKIFDRQYYWSGAKEFQGLYSAGVVREQQYADAQNGLWRVQTHLCFLQSTQRSVSTGRHEKQDLTDEQHEFRRTAHAYIRIARDDGDLNSTRTKGRYTEELPGDGTLFKLRFRKGKHNERAREGDYWVGRVVAVPPVHLKNVGADFCMFVQRPLRAGKTRKMWAKPSLEANRDLLRVDLEAISDRTGPQSKLDALREFAADHRDDLRPYRDVFLGNRNANAPTIDITAGQPVAGVDYDAEANQKLHRDVVTSLYKSRGLTEEQRRLLGRAKQIQNKLSLYTGPPGTQKTTSACMVIISLLCVDHKIAIAADANGATNNICVALHKSIQRAVEDKRFPAAEKLKGKKGLRLAPTSMSFKELKKTAQGSIKSGDGMFDTAKTDPNKVLDDPFFKEMVDLMTATFAEESDDASGTIEDILAARDQLHNDYMEFQQEGGRNMLGPIEWNATYRIHLMLAEDAKLGDESPSKRFVTLKALEKEDGLSKEDNKTLRDETVNLFRRVIVDTDFIISMCNNFGSELVLESNWEPSIVFIEEAGQCAVPSALIPMTMHGVKATYVFGDPIQLEPTSRAKDKSEASRQMTLSILKYLIEKGVPHLELHTQFRMAPSIAMFINRWFYGGRLTNAPNTLEDNKWRRAVRRLSRTFSIRGEDGVGSEYFLLNTMLSKARKLEKTKSLYNSVDAAIMIEMARVLLTEHPSEEERIFPEDISIISFYKGQLVFIKLQISIGPLGGIQIEASTIDAFQGRDNRIILCGLVAAAAPWDPKDDEAWDDSLSSFVRNPNRLNVALTRAKDGLIVVGNMATLIPVRQYSGQSSTSAGSLEAMVQDAMDRNCLGHTMLEDEEFNALPQPERLRHIDTVQKLLWMTDLDNRELPRAKVSDAGGLVPRKFGGRIIRPAPLPPMAIEAQIEKDERKEKARQQTNEEQKRGKKARKGKGQRVSLKQ
jgi:hypothetical protein